MYLLGITGKKGSGKDTVYGILKELLAHEISPRLAIERVAFADTLKEEVANAFGVPVSFINEHKEDFRLILQGWGQAKKKFVRPDYWIWKWSIKVNSLPETCYLLVTTDVRFLIENKMFKELGGKIIRVIRYYNRPLDPDLHISETEQDNIQADFEIVNNGTLEDLRQSVKVCLAEIKSKYINGNKYNSSTDSTRARIIHS